MKRFINYLMEQKREDDLEKRAMRYVLEELTGNFNDMSEKLDKALDEQRKALDELHTVRNELKGANKKALKYEELYNRAMQELYGTRQNRVSSAKKVRKGNPTVRTAPVPGEATAPTAMTSPTVIRKRITMTAYF